MKNDRKDYRVHIYTEVFDDGYTEYVAAFPELPGKTGVW